MEFDKIQQLSSAAKVMRTNSEQQRRRRDQNAREFSELLEENLEEENPSKEDAESSEPAATQDTVSISSTGKVSAETMHAAGNLAKLSLTQRQMLDLFNPTINTLADATDTKDSVKDSSQIDEVV